MITDNFQLESRTNHNNLVNDPVRPVSIADRAVTFDGSEHTSTHRLQTTNAYIRQPCERVAERVVVSSRSQASRCLRYLGLI